MNRLLTEAFTDGSRHTYTYDEAGNRVTTADSTGLTVTTYTVRNEVLAEEVPGGEAGDVQL